MNHIKVADGDVFSPRAVTAKVHSLVMLAFVSCCRELNLGEVLGNDGVGFNLEELSTLVVVGEQVRRMVMTAQRRALSNSSGSP